jgi:hypothetical protein
MSSLRTVVPLPVARRQARSIVLVVGSGRSGTSLFAGIMQRLGYTVPRPEVPADDTNPRGFGESQWVVDFHTRLLKRAGVQVADGRPSAWAETARAGLEPQAAADLGAWLAGRLAESGHLIVKDPRASWFLPLWRRCALELDVAPRYVTMLRHPAEVIASKQHWYGDRHGETPRLAGWLNQTLFTERATRGGPRVFVAYDDLLGDWTQAVEGVGRALDLELVARATPAAMRSVHEFVDAGLRRSRAEWQAPAVPAPLRELADETWQLARGLARDPDTDRPALHARLDELRAAYTQLYGEAQAIAQSSIAAAVRPRPRPPRERLPRLAAWLIRHVPARYRRRVPPAVRARALRALRARRI